MAATGLKFDPTAGAPRLHAATARSAADVYSVDLETRKLTRWTDSEVGGLEPGDVRRRRELIDFPTFDGRTHPGLVLPAPQRADAGPRRR